MRFAQEICVLCLLVASVSALLCDRPSPPRRSARRNQQSLATAKVPTLERSALQDLFESTAGSDWIWEKGQGTGARWDFSLPDTDPCVDNWQGVVCAISTGGDTNVVALCLEGYNMTGYLPGTLSQLSVIQELFLARNSLDGTIPAALADLQNLTHVMLHFNNLRGALPDLGASRSIFHLDCSTNYLTGTIPRNIGNMSNLNSLFLFANSLSGTIPLELGNITSLVNLDLAVNFLNGSIPHTINKLSNLQGFDFGANLLSGSIPDVFAHLSNIGAINVGINRLTGQLPPSMGALNHLRVLGLFANKFSGTFPESWGNMSTLVVLKMDNNSVGGTIPESFSGMVSLEEFYVDKNQFIGTFPQFLLQLPLVNLYLSSNVLHGSLPQNISAMSSLQYLGLEKNQFTGTIPPSIGDMTTLSYLILNNNLMKGTVPKTLKNMPKLSILQLQYNAFEGTLDGVFTASAQNLRTVQLNNNQFSGELPSELFAMSSLITLVAVSNCFHGSLPDNICDATSIQSLILDGLSSADTCRRYFTPIHKASSAYMVHHPVHGTIAPCLLQLPHLISLHLSGNGLSGHLPNVNITSTLIDFTVAHNLLSGTIPATIQEKAWLSLDLSYNRFSGTLGHNFSTQHEFAVSNHRHGVLSSGQYKFEQLLLLLHNARNSENTESNYTIFDGRNLALVNNRISGHIPAVLHNMVNISILGSNVFSCNILGTDLPTNDINTPNYQCGSAAFEIPYYVWLGLVMVLLIVVVLRAYWVVHVNPVYAVNIELYKNGCLNGLPSGKPSRTALMMDLLRTMCLYVTLFIVVVLVPLYVFCAYYYGTLTHSYAWVVSAAYLSGPIPVALEMPLWTLCLCIFLYVYTMDRDVIPTALKAVTNLTPLYQTLKIYVSHFIINVVVVVGVNIGYVYVAIYGTTRVLLFTQVVLSVFKLTWNNLCTSYILRRIVNYITGADKRDADAEYAYLQVLIALINNIVIPCLVVACVSPSCYYNVFVPAPTVSSYYIYQYCAIDGPNNGQCVITVPKSEETTYHPPFEYSYQCSSSLVTYYSPAFVILCIVSVFVAPPTQFFLAQYFSTTHPDSYANRFIINFMPSSMYPIRADGSSPPLFSSMWALISLVTYLGILLTFGVVFPPLAVAVAVTVTIVVYMEKLRLGRVICAARDAPDMTYYHSLESDREIAGNAMMLQHAVWMLVVISCWFYTVFLFDTVGDGLGVKRAFWVLIAMPLMPIVIAMVYMLYDKKEHSQSETKAEAIEMIDVVYTNNPVYKRSLGGSTTDAVNAL